MTIRTKISNQLPSDTSQPEHDLIVLLANRYCSQLLPASTPDKRRYVTLISVLAALCGEAYLRKENLFSGNDHLQAAYTLLENPPSPDVLTGGARTWKEAVGKRTPLGRIATHLDKLSYPLEKASPLSALTRRVQNRGLSSFGYAPTGQEQDFAPLIPPMTSNLDLRDEMRLLCCRSFNDNQTAFFESSLLALASTLHLLGSELPPESALDTAYTTFLATLRFAPLLPSHTAILAPKAPEIRERRRPTPAPPDLTAEYKQAAQELSERIDGHFIARGLLSARPAQGQANIMALWGALTADAVHLDLGTLSSIEAGHVIDDTHMDKIVQFVAGSARNKSASVGELFRDLLDARGVFLPDWPQTGQILAHTLSAPDMLPHEPVMCLGLPASKNPTLELLNEAAYLRTFLEGNYAHDIPSYARWMTPLVCAVGAVCELDSKAEEHKPLSTTEAVSIYIHTLYAGAANKPLRAPAGNLLAQKSPSHRLQ